MSDIILDVKNLKKYFPKKKNSLFEATSYLRAVDGVSFQVKRGETFGLVGESGCGKTTVSRSIMGMHQITGGEIYFEGQEISNIRGLKRRPIQREMQMVFQNPYYSLNPRMTVCELVEEPLVVHGIGTPSERRKQVAELLNMVGLGSKSLTKYPHEFSGGQRQRIGIARSIALKPKLIICDEPVSALDVSIQAQILNLLNSLQKEFNLTYIFISHNLSVVEYMSQNIAVMYMGRIVEIASSKDLYNNPQHPYTKALLSAIPEVDVNRKRERILLNLELQQSDFGEKCPFLPRCWRADHPGCKEEPIGLVPFAENHQVACHWFK